MEPIRTVQTLTFNRGILTVMDLAQHDIYIYAPNNNMETDIINYGFSAPLLLVFGQKAFTKAEASDYAEQSGLAKIAAENGGTVIFVNPERGKNWDEEGYGIYEEVLGKTRLSQRGFSHGILYDRKIAHDPFEAEYLKKLDPDPEYFIFGSTVALYVYANGAGADYIARNYLKSVKGQSYMGDLGEGDLTMTAATLENLSSEPIVDTRDIRIVSISNSEQINGVLQKSCDHVVICDQLDVVSQYDAFIGDYKRWKGRVMTASNYRKEGIVMEPGRCMVKTSVDNKSADAARPEHEAGYVLFYDKDTNFSDPADPRPLLLCFHGGGDSAVATAMIGMWPEIAKKNRFILCAIEMHMSVTAAETMQVVKMLQNRFAIDPTRIYATGFSMGGIKSWDFFQEYPSVFAAVAPMGATVEPGENSQFETSARTNDSIPVPVFYTGGESSPLAELPCQAEKCVHRINDLFKVNRVSHPYHISFENKDSWQEAFYGVHGDIEKTFEDTDYPDSLTTVRYFRSDDGNIYTALASISHHMHEIRPNTCRIAWNFIRQFRRMPDGSVWIDD